MSDALRYICLDSLIYTDDMPRDTFLKKSLRQIYTRGCQVYYEVIVLVANGLANGAWARWRTLYELSIMAEFISENGEKAAKKFYEANREDRRYYEWARTLPCFKNFRKQITFQEIYRRCNYACENWNEAYRTASVTIHACTKGTFESFSGNDAVARLIRSGKPLG